MKHKLIAATPALILFLGICHLDSFGACHQDILRPVAIEEEEGPQGPPRIDYLQKKREMLSRRPPGTSSAARRRARIERLFEKEIMPLLQSAQIPEHLRDIVEANLGRWIRSHMTDEHKERLRASFREQGITATPAAANAVDEAFSLVWAALQDDETPILLRLGEAQI